MRRNQDEENIDEVDAKLRDINDNWKKYNKSLENIYDDAEIEAEIEAEKKIKSKTSKLKIIFIISFILIPIIIFKVTQNTNEIQSLLNINPITKSRTTNLTKNLFSVSPQKELERVKLQSNKNVRTKNFNPDVTKQLTSKIQPLKNNNESKKPIQVARPDLESNNKYFIQMGVFSNKSNAINYSTKIKSKGYKVESIIRDSISSRYQVTLGSYKEKSEAAKIIIKLKSIGLNPSLKKHGQTYTLELGLFKNKAGSKRLSNKLENNGLEPVTSKITIRNAHYIVRINGFLSKREARKSHQQLISQGFKNSFIRPT